MNFAEPEFGQSQRIIQIVPAPPGLIAEYDAPGGEIERYPVPVFALVEGQFDDGTLYREVRAMRMPGGKMFDSLEFVKYKDVADYRGMFLGGDPVE